MGRLKKILNGIEKPVVLIKNDLDKFCYNMGGKKPWSRGYDTAKFEFIMSVLNDEGSMGKFRNNEALPVNFGYGLDERVCEYPWALARLSDQKTKVLDAGSVFNFEEILDHPKLARKELTIFTLAPESQAFWDKGISYHYGDLRQLPFKDGCFDEICCISTLGHVGMDNRLYKKDEIHHKISLEADRATKELLRVLRPKGTLLISVVFGKPQLIEWDGTPFAQQFDSRLLKNYLGVFTECARVNTVFYKYTDQGWNVSTEAECSQAEYFNIHKTRLLDADLAAAARSVVFIEVVK